MDPSDAIDQMDPISATDTIDPICVTDGKRRKIVRDTTVVIDNETDCVNVLFRWLRETDIELYDAVFDGLLRLITGFITFADSLLAPYDLLRQIERQITAGSEVCLNWQLLYRASRDTPSAFHAHCDNRGPTVTIARVISQGTIVGGYTSNDWVSYRLGPARIQLPPMSPHSHFVVTHEARFGYPYVWPKRIDKHSCDNASFLFSNHAHKEKFNFYVAIEDAGNHVVHHDTISGPRWEPLKLMGRGDLRQNRCCDSKLFQTISGKKVHGSVFVGKRVFEIDDLEVFAV